ncbi:hypothetical protein GCM10029978_071030 [Actinoallomurus acanthiterrae]
MEIFTTWRTWEQARAALASWPVDLATLDRAADVALRRHGDQTRPTGAPYVEHLLEALEVLVRGVGVTETDLLVTALLHDVVEDTPATLADVEAEFGPVVGELVDWVTKPPVRGKAAKRAAKVSYLRRLRDAPREAILVKLADRVSNVQTLDRMPLDFQRRYHAETVTYIVPLAAGEPWFAAWFADWQERFAHLR